MGASEIEQASDSAGDGVADMYKYILGVSKDPEHLPLTNIREYLGNALRKVGQFLGSPESAFGFRGACATLIIGIVAFLESTLLFFTQQRLIWAMIIVGMLVSLIWRRFSLQGKNGKTDRSAVECQ